MTTILQIMTLSFRLHFSLLLVVSTFNHITLAQTGPMFQGTSGHSGYYSDTMPTSFGSPLWKLKTKGKIFSSPVMADDVLYVGSEDGFLYAINASTGTVKWKFKTRRAVHSTPSVYGNMVYFGSFDGHYYGVDIRTGKMKWRFKTGGEKWQGGRGYLGLKPDTLMMDDPWEYFLSSPIVQEIDGIPVVFFGSSDSHVYAVDALDGKLAWKFKTGDIVHTTPAFDDDNLYIGSWDTFMYALNKRTGKELWRFKTGDQIGMSGIQASPTVYEGKLYFGARDAHFYALNTGKGELLWKYAAENAWILSTAAIDRDNLYVGTSDSYLLLAINATNGKEVWRSKLKGYVFSSPAVTRNAVYIADFTGNVYAIRKSDGKIQDTFSTEGRLKNGPKILTTEDRMDFMKLAAGKDLSQYRVNMDVMRELYKLGSIVSSALIQKNMLYVGSADGMLYAIPLTETPAAAQP
ncbi:MAG TPA: PQQ-binding-like beta-propeller repeat protein [Ohtaekwangia sp.]|nr:PQQ-binding-like beta-propeller repeat protein [Ohtaekwangia sp.]